ncbi:MAG: phosphoribosyltransferase domain-containing protein [Mycobacterium sp.]
MGGQVTAEATAPWATRQLGLELVPTDSVAGYDVPTLVQPGLRRNPRRAHLLVSTVLGKHLPATPDAVLDAGNRLGDLVAAALGDRASEAVVLGFAETATGLGHCVAARIGARCYLHSTRRQVSSATVLTSFEEGHSHATCHMLQPSHPELFDNDAPLVLVDDEISTGATAIDAIRALAGAGNGGRVRDRHVIASLVDMRTPDHHAATEQAARSLGTMIDAVALATGATVLPVGLIDAVAALPDPILNIVGERAGRASRVVLPWPREVPDGGRHGFLASDAVAFDEALAAAADVLLDRLDPSRRVIVVGHEELMYLPLRLAAALADAGLAVRFQTTTRSPAYVLDQPGYPLRRGFTFVAPERGEGTSRYLYNAQWPDGDGLSAHLVIVVDPPADTERLTGPSGLVDVMTAAGQDVVVAVVPGADPATLQQSRSMSS